MYETITIKKKNERIDYHFSINSKYINIQCS